MVKKLYRIVSLLSLVTLLSLGGGIGYLWAGGKLDRAQVDQIAAILRGESAAVEAPPASGTESEPPAVESAASLDRKQINDDAAWRNHQRRTAELDQRKTLIQMEMLRVEKKREAFEKEQELLAQQQKARSEKSFSQGFQKELELLGKMKPKQGLELLMAKAPEDAAQLLLKLDSRITKKIIETAKTAAEKAKINELINLMRELAPVDEGAGGTTQS